MASTSRLILASAWGLESEAVKELENEFKKTGVMTDCHGDYSKTDDVLVLRGGLEGSLSKPAGILSQYIEEQENKDLLDVPRVYRLEVPAVLHDEPIPVQTHDTSTREGELLSLGPSPEEELMPHSRVTKTWYSSDGGSGCFSSQFHDILSEISKLTGTEITVVEDPKGIQVTGRNENDTDDALAKITTIEKPLSCTLNHYVTNVGIPPEDASSLFQMQYYSNLNQAARRRILADPSLSSTPSLYRGFVTVSLAFDEDSQVLKLPCNLLNPPQIGDGPGGESRIWSDFTFQEFGKADQFNVEDIVETAHSEAKSSSVEESPSHRYLSAAKAMQVDKWVNERAEIEQTEPAPELSSVPQPETSCEPKPATNTMKPPGIKSRRVVPSVQKQSASPSKSTISQYEPLNAPGDDKSQSPRKKWKDTFTIKVAPSTSQVIGLGLNSPNEEIDKRQESALCGVTTNVIDAKLPGSRAHLASNSVTSKYAKNKSIRIPANDRRDNHRPRANENTSSWSNNKPRRGSELIDTSVPACTVNANVLPLLFMNQPALVPEKASGVGTPEHDSENGAISFEVNNSTDLAGLSFETDGSSSPCPNSIPSSQEASSSSTDPLEQEKRLDQLKKTLLDQVEIDRINEADAFAAHKPRPRCYANQVYRKEKLEELDRIHGSETAQPTGEVATRKYYHTMKQKTAKPIGKAKGKAEVKAKKQATLEDAWGLLRKPTRTTDGTSRIEKVSSKLGKDAEAKQEKPQPQQPRVDELRMDEDIKHVFGALKQTLEAAEYFPGTLNLELKFGLLLIPLLPKTYAERSMSLDEWTRIFQPQTGIAPPTTKFISRLTTSGSDVDHIVDLKTSKAEGKRRIFEQEDNEYCVFYEFHCRTKSDKPIIIVMNDQGAYTLKHPTTTLGGVNLHFPGQTWDAHLGVSGGLRYQDGSDPELEEAAQYLVNNSCVVPNRTLVQIFTKIPDGNKIRIEKVFMKRWTRHRYVRTDDVSPKDATSPEIEANVDQDIFLQVTEVQDLIIGTCDTDSQAKRARCMPLLSMLKAARQWYEVSLVSPTIETVLKANANLELGERTVDWRTTDLFGNDASLVCDKPAGSAEARASISASPVASAIGDAGIGHLLRLAKKIIGKMDGVGYWNYNPQADTDAVRMPPPSSFSIPPAPNALTVASLKNITAKPGSKGFSFDELESIKDVGSAIMDITLTKKSSPVSSVKPMEQIEEEYW